MILELSLTHKTNRFLKKNATRKNISYKKAEKIGIICSHHTRSPQKKIETLKGLLKNDKKNVEVLIYNCNNNTKPLPFESFAEKDINFWGKIIKKSVQKFSETSFDFLICLDYNPKILIIKNLIAKSKAKCKIGIGNNFKKYQKLFDLIIQDANNYNIVDSIYTYTKNIR